MARVLEADGIDKEVQAVAAQAALKAAAADDDPAAARCPPGLPRAVGSYIGTCPSAATTSRWRV